MSFTVTEEQQELGRSVRQFLANKSPISEVRRLMETSPGYDAAVWTQMASQLGLTGLIIPEEYGGSGFGYNELIIVLEEMGRALLGGPYFATVALATNAILAAADHQAMNAVLPGIAAGNTIATLAVAEENGRWEPDGIELTASPAGDGFTLRGRKMYVIDGHIADLIITVARIGGQLAFFAVDGSADGLIRTLLPTLDMTRKQARLDFADTPARLIGSPDAAEAALATTLDRVVIALAAEQVGGAQRCLDMSVDYAKTRVQFGRPIGSFQAIKHKCADMLLEVESARSAAYFAGWAVAEDSDERAAVASLAKSYCSETYFHAAAENIQIHGGIGFTWEHDAHLYFKRAKSSELLFGDPAYHRELLVQRIGI